MNDYHVDSAEEHENANDQNINEEIGKAREERHQNKNCHELLRRINNRYFTLIEKTLQDEDCSICLEKKKVIVLPNCNHYFCRECIEEHSSTNEKCPICREEMIGYFDPAKSKFISLKKDLQTSDEVKIVHLDDLGLAHIVTGGQLFHTYLTKESPIDRIRKNLRFFVVGVAVGAAYFLYRGNKN